jgi:thiol:disulfide interchange protein DsbD
MRLFEGSRGRWCGARAVAWALLVALMAAYAEGRSAWAASASEPNPFEEPVPTGATAKVKAEQVVRFVVAEVTSDAQGAVTGVSLSFSTRAGFKIYDKGLRFEAHPAFGEPWVLAHQSKPPPLEAHDPWYDEVRATHSDGAVFQLTTTTSMQRGEEIRVRFEACSVSMCLLPVWFRLALQEGALSQPIATPAVSVPAGDTVSEWRPQPPTPAAASSQPQPQVTRPSLTDRVTLFVQDALSGRSPWLFPALFFAGLLMNLTPCIYPMIPITLNVLGRLGRRGSLASGGSPQGEAEHWTEGFVRASIYVLGIVLTYSAMGVVAGMTGTLFGSLLQSTGVIVALAVLFFALGLGMLGIVDLSRVQAWASRIPISEKSPHLGVFTMGAVSGLVSAPCTGPVLSAILVLIGQSKDPVYGLALMAFFSLGFGAPYLVLGMFAHNLKRLPRAGHLLDLVKVVFAALLFALALYYLRPLLSDLPVFDRIYADPGLQGFALGVAIAVIFRLAARSAADSSGDAARPGRQAVLRVGFVLSMTQLALWLTLYVTSAFVVSAASQPLGSTVAVQPSSVRWHSSWETAVATARVEGKGLLVDAWAQWCAACLKMDASLWVDPQVVERVHASYVPLKLDFTQASPFTDAIGSRWELTGLPGVALFPKGADFEGKPAHLFRQEVGRDELFAAMYRLAP